MIDTLTMNTGLINLTSLTLAADPVGHVVNHVGPSWFPFAGGWNFSMHVGQLILAGIITLGILLFAASFIKTGPESAGTERYITRNPVAHIIEVICGYLRDDTVRPLLHGRTDKFMPFLWTVFFFILVNNVLGLIPLLDIQHLLFPGLAESHAAVVGGTATQNIAVTAVLAIIAFLVVNFAGIKELGIGGYLGHMTGGAPMAVAPLIFVLELVGTFIKPVALAIRLFANMTAGHILMAVLFSFVLAGVGLVSSGSPLIGGTITVASFIGAVAINMLELFVAFLQAFVFTFLTAVFISQLAHHDDHEHHGEHDHEHAHA